MKAYYITTYATIERPQMTCSYPYWQWKELIKEFKKSGVDFYAYEEDYIPCDDLCDDWDY